MLLKHRYKIIQELSEGGFGKTYLAEDTQMPSGRYCVIKQLKPIANDSQIYQLVQERFQREAAILEELGTGHPQIPTLYAYFREADLFYLVQEWIEGETLTQKLQRAGVISESTVKSLLVDLLPIFEYLHTRGIVHRDVKPDNIILRTSDNLPILIDFGAVRETMGTVVNSQGNPTSSIIIGTPGFMPSEQAAGRPIFASDLYALGLTAIYLLTGKIPQELPTDPQTGEILWRQYALTVSPTFANVLDRAIMSHARDRFSHAREMLAALQEEAVPIVATVASLGVNIPPTIPLSNPSIFPPLPIVQSTSSTKPILLAGAIAGGLIGISTIIGLALTRSSKETTNQETTALSSIPQTPDSPSSAMPQATEIENTNLPVENNQGVGWIRIGAVQNLSVTLQDGVPLVATNQPVTIQPTVIPQNNTQVTILTGVNVRKGVPEPPNYDLKEQISVLPPGTKVIVLQKKAFVTPSNPSATVVWAEVRIP